MTQTQISPDGQWMWNGAAWVPNTPPAPPPPPPAPVPPPPMPSAAAYAPPPAPAQPYAQAPAPPQAYIPQAPPMPSAATAYGASSSAEIDFAATAWTSGGLPVGQGYVVLIEDIEAGESQNNNPKVTFTGKTLLPNGKVAAGTRALWTYTLTEKAEGKLGKDMLALNIQRAPRQVQALAQALLGQLRGKAVIVNSSESKTSDMPNTAIVGFYEQSAAPAAPQVAAPAPPPQFAQAMPVSPPQFAQQAAQSVSPPPALTGYAVSYPIAPPPPPTGAAAFRSV